MWLKTFGAVLLGLFAGTLALGQTAPVPLVPGPPSSPPPLITTADPQGVAALEQALNAAGGAQVLAQIHDFTAIGTITVRAGKQVQGTVTIRGQAPDAFRLDASLPEGSRSYAVLHGAGTRKDAEGTATSLPLHNTINMGIVTFPFLTLLAELNSPSTGVKYVGAVSDGTGGQLIDVRVERNFSTAADPQGIASRLCVKDYFIDPQTSHIVKVTDMIHPVETLTRSYPHEIDLEDYTLTGGVAVPMLVREKINGQTTWELQLQSISFNTGLTDPDFVLQ